MRKGLILVFTSIIISALLIFLGCSKKDKPEVILGDVNCDNVVDTLDCIALTDYLFKNADKPNCLYNADINGDSEVTVSDVFVLCKKTEL